MSPSILPTNKVEPAGATPVGGEYGPQRSRGLISFPSRWSFTGAVKFSFCLAFEKVQCSGQLPVSRSPTPSPSRSTNCVSKADTVSPWARVATVPPALSHSKLFELRFFLGSDVLDYSRNFPSSKLPDQQHGRLPSPIQISDEGCCMTNVYVDWFPSAMSGTGSPRVVTNVRPGQTKLERTRSLLGSCCLMSTVAFPWTTKSVVPERQPL